MKKYTISKKRALQDLNQADWEKRLDILRLRTQGWTYQKIADKYNDSRQNIQKTYKKIAHLSVENAEILVKALKDYAE